MLCTRITWHHSLRGYEKSMENSHCVYMMNVFPVDFSFPRYECQGFLCINLSLYEKIFHWKFVPGCQNAFQSTLRTKCLSAFLQDCWDTLICKSYSSHCQCASAIFFWEYAWIVKLSNYAGWVFRLVHHWIEYNGGNSNGSLVIVCVLLWTRIKKGTEWPQMTFNRNKENLHASCKKFPKINKMYKIL